jgi:hypothetical protein
MQGIKIWEQNIVRLGEELRERSWGLQGLGSRAGRSNVCLEPCCAVSASAEGGGTVFSLYALSTASEKVSGLVSAGSDGRFLTR